MDHSSGAGAAIPNGPRCSATPNGDAGAKLLVVDDDAAQVSALVCSLRGEGYEAVGAHSAAQALEQLRAERFEVLITDLQMPGMDGVSLLDRALAIDPEMVGIVMTGHGTIASAVGALKAGALDYILKPFNLTAILPILSRAVTMRRLRSENATLTRHLAERNARLEELNRELQAANRELEAVASGERARAVAELRASEERFRQLADNIEDVLYVVTPDLAEILYVSPAYERVWGRSRQELLEDPLVWTQYVHPDDRESTARERRRLIAALPEPGRMEFRIVRPDGSVRWILTRIFAACDPDGSVQRAVGISTDVTERNLDVVTGLANRNLFHERLTQHTNMARQQGTCLAVILANPQRLDALTESLGRPAADQLMRDVASQFGRCVGSPDLVGRIGSDRLAAIVTGLREATDLSGAVEDLWRNWLTLPFVVAAQEIALSAIAGVAVFPSDGADAESLMRNAEAALRNAQASGKRFSAYTARLSEQLAERSALEKNMMRALENSEFVLHYQPKVDLETRRLEGLEALVRWQSPELGLVPPAKFIPLVEENGLIVELGAWVLRQAVLDRSRWRELGLDAPRIAVNVSTVQLRRDDFVRTIGAIMRLAGDEAGIDIEVTESLLMQDVAENLAKLAAIRNLGVGIALDDFGTGYSSLGYLAKLPVQTLKIDRSFVASMLDDPCAMTLVSTILSLAGALKLETVAEGVESEDQARILRLLRCDQMQGFLVSRPLPFETMTEYLGRAHT